MVGFPAKQAKTVEEEVALEVVDQQDSKVKAFKDTLDFPSIDSFLDFDSVNWLGTNRNIEEFGLEDKDFDFFEDEMEMGQEAVTVSDELRLENQTMAEEKSELCGDITVEVGVSSIRSDSMVEVKPVLYDVMVEEIGVSSVKPDSMIEVVEPKLCDDMSANFDGGVEPAVKESEPVVSDPSRPMEAETEPVAVSVTCPTMNMDESKVKEADQGLASSIEVGLEKVSLTVDDDEKSGGVKGKTDCAESESETSSSSSSSSDSSSSAEEESDEEESEEEESEEEMKFEDQMVMGKEDDVAGDLEEGEIENVDVNDKNEVDDDDDDDDDDDVNEMIAWGIDDDEDFGLQTKEPIRSKNELKELPPVKAVNEVLQPHHTLLPVGVVLSVMNTQVIVEGRERHSPLNEDSILWITEKETPLGLVDEIFGPVKCPYYIVRFNTESDVPEGISQGTHVSFVADFARHVLEIENLQSKGYDASGDNDEEILEVLEFSDDEEEAKHRKDQKVKRGMMNDQKTGNSRNKKKKNRDLGKPTSSYSGEWTENQGSSSLSSNHSDPQTGGPVSNLQPRPQMNGLTPNNAAWRPQSNQQNPYQLPPIPNQMGMPNLGPMQIPLMAMQNQNQMMFQPQFNGGQMPMPGGLNFFPGQASAPWPALVGQNCFNQQPFGMGRGIQQPLNELSFNLFSQGLQMHQQQPQMHRPQSSMNPQFQMPPQFQTHPQSSMNPQYQMMHPPQSTMNQQFQMQPQSEPRPQSQIPQSPTNPQSPMQPESQGFNSRQSSEGGRGFHGRGRGRGRGRLGRGRGRGRQQSG